MDSNLHVEIYERPEAITTKRVQYVMTMILSALTHMHERNIVHRDLKPSNILVNKRGQIKLCDLGLAIELASGGHLRSKVGTRPYQAPEMFLGSYNEKVDIWVMFIYCHVK